MSDSTPRASAIELRGARDALVLRLALAADDVEVLGEGASIDVRDRWIARAHGYVHQRQSAVDRLAEIDAALGGEAPDPACRRALERILEADRILLSDAGRIVAELQAETTGRRAAVRAARSYARTGGDTGPIVQRIW